MTELIKIRESYGKKAVSARELYEKLGYARAVWSRWYKDNITKNKLAKEHQDWECIAITINGNKTKDFAISIDFAKKLCMMARTETGELIREYFISVEKRYNVAISSMVGERLELKSEKFILE